MAHVNIIDNLLLLFRRIDGLTASPAALFTHGITGRHSFSKLLTQYNATTPRPTTSAAGHLFQMYFASHVFNPYGLDQRFSSTHSSPIVLAWCCSSSLGRASALRSHLERHVSSFSMHFNAAAAAIWVYMFESNTNSPKRFYTIRIHSDILNRPVYNSFEFSRHVVPLGIDVCGTWQCLYKYEHVLFIPFWRANNLPRPFRQWLFEARTKRGLWMYDYGDFERRHYVRIYDISCTDSKWQYNRNRLSGRLCHCCWYRPTYLR